MTDHDRLRGWVNTMFDRAAHTEFPTVRKAARALGWPQQRVIEAVDGDPDGDLMLTGYNIEERRDGDLFVETLDSSAPGAA